MVWVWLFTFVFGFVRFCLVCWLVAGLLLVGLLDLVVTFGFGLVCMVVVWLL